MKESRHMHTRSADPAALERVADAAGRLERELGKAIIGQQRVIREILIAFVAGGHCLLRGVPGLAKTLLIKTLADCVDLKFNRIQFTPDLMPSDIVGAEVIEEDRATGKRAIRFIHGPIFANIILADEINRTPPKTQAALLEAMQEYQVTVSGVRFALERPLFVLATQNPIEQEGTYPLPEAQLDRFMFNVVIEYPTRGRGAADPVDDDRDAARAGVEPVATGEEIEQLHALVREVPGGRERRRLRGAAGACDADPAGGSRRTFVQKWVRWGAGPRAGQALLLGAKARGAARRTAASPRLRRHAPSRCPVLRHRVLRELPGGSRRHRHRQRSSTRCCRGWMNGQ